MLDGFCVVDVFPFPKLQFHELGGPVERSVKFVGTPIHTGLELKLATGGVLLEPTVIVSIWLHPLASVIVTE